MNVQRLLQHYERIADAPDAIARLRRFVLDLAVRGKLVPQNAGDEPPVGRLATARAELRQQAETAKRMRWKETKPVSKNEIDKDVPLGWAAARINDTGLYINGLAFKPSDWKQSGVPIIRIQNLTDPQKEFNYVTGDFPDEVIVRNGDLLVSWSATLQAFRWERGEGVLNQHIFRVIPHFELTDRNFLLLLLRSAIREMAESEHAHGLVMAHINRGAFLNHVVLIPPLAEQQRIVAKVDELMGLCDRLEAAREAREATRDRLAAASLARLNTPDHYTFKDDACFTLDALPALTTRPDQIKRLRQTILNLAVRGKIVPQDPSDEPASELLKRIAKEKAGSKKSEAGGVCNSPSEIDGFDAQLNLPIGWAWATLGAITHIGTGLTPSKARSDYYEGGNIPWINSSATSEDVIQEARFFVTQKAVKECRLKIFPAGSLVVALYGQGKTRGQVAELGLDATVNQACAVVQWLPSFQEIKGFVSLTLAQQYDAMRERAEGGPQPNLNVGKIKDRHFPLPPLAEQHRIVAKVDALMTQCDRLEASLDQTAATRRRLLDALLAEALAPVDAREMAAAE